MMLPESAEEVLSSLVDQNSFTAGEQVQAQDDPLGWAEPKPYAAELQDVRAKTGIPCGVMWGTGEIGRVKVVLAANDVRFFLGSMGIREAATLSRCMEAAMRERLPLIWIARGSGVRLQEGTYALTAIAQVLSVRNALAAEGSFLITIASDPLFGGMTLCAMQADVVLAVAGARVGFAGARVIRMFEKMPFPEEFQTASYAFANGQVDEVVRPDKLRNRLADLLRTVSRGKHHGNPMPEAASASPGDGYRAWEYVERARSKKKPATREIIASVFEGFFQLRGDRINGDDPAVLGGIARIGNRPVMIIGHDTARDTEGMARHNFAMAHAAGHRKAIRLVRLANRIGLPIVTLIDTPGACPDVRGEAEGLGGVMGALLCEMLAAKVPTVSVILGEGGSGGAAVFAGVDSLIMTDASYYTVVSPEGAAAIVWKDPDKAIDAAEALKLTPHDLLKAGLVDAVVTCEPSVEATATRLRAAILRGLEESASSTRIRIPVGE